MKVFESNDFPFLFDGATGTELYNRGIFINRCFEDANLASPQLVKQLHQEYLDAGANILTTNSWGANRFKLGKHNLHDKTREINLRAAQLAKEVSVGKGFVAGSVGPLGVRIEPWGPTSFEEAYEAFREQIRALVEGGVDLITFETFADISELQQAIRAAKDVSPNVPIAAQIVIDVNGKMPAGTPIEWAIQKVDEWGADIVGLNCSVGPQPMLSALPKIKTITKKPLIMQPNAGLPREVDGRKIYMCTPEYMGEFAKNFLIEGVQFIGGCCGTSPEHVRYMAQALRHFRAMNRPQGIAATTQSNDTSEKVAPKIEAKKSERLPLAKKSSWSKKIAAGEKVYSIELLPPSSVVPFSIVEKSRMIKDAGVDAINVPDGPRASARMSAILTAVMIEQQVGIETVLHYTCRDRNLLGMQSDMLGAHAIGLRNMLLVTGDPPKMGVYPNATGVFDVDAIGLTNMVHRLNGGIDIGGREIGQPTALSIGVGVNPVHQNFDYEMKRFYYKVDAGAEWAITQPVFDVRSLLRFMEYIEKKNIKIPIIAGIWPMTSLRNAEFMNNEVPGVVIPHELIKKMAEPKTPEDAKKVGVEIAQKMVEELDGIVQGFQVSAPFGRIDMALQVIGKDSET